MTVMQETRSGFAPNEARTIKRHAGQEPTHNVSQSERYASLASGALVAALGLARRDAIGGALAVVGAGLLYRGASGNCPLYNALGVDTNTPESAQKRAQQQKQFARGFRVTQAFTIDRSPEDLYGYWRDLQNLPRIMTHLEEVRVIDDKRSHWVAHAPAIAGGKVEWDAETLQDIPNELIAWRSLEGSQVENAGSVRFASSPRGTIVRVDMRYVAPAGRLGKWVATIFGDNPESQIREDLRNFKRTMEIGEILTIRGQSHGTCMGWGTRLFELGHKA